MKWFCKHEWKVISEKVTESAFESASKTPGVEITNAGLLWHERKFIQIVACEKCGELKRFVEEI